MSEERWWEGEGCVRISPRYAGASVYESGVRTDRAGTGGDVASIFRDRSKFSSPPGPVERSPAVRAHPAAFSWLRQRVDATAEACTRPPIISVKIDPDKWGRVTRFFANRYDYEPENEKGKIGERKYRRKRSEDGGK